MNKSNVMEIKKTLKITQDFMPSINTICTCFVNGEKNKLMSNTESYVSLDEEESFKYIEIFKGVLTGAIGKKLVNFSFDSSNESAQKKLSEYQHQIFTDEEVRNDFFDQIIENYELGENYVIIAGHGVYDVPIKASDGAVLEDETDTYEFMLVGICPVHSTKAGLTFDSKSGRLVSSRQIQIIEAPVNGFLYPAFNDRQTDLYSFLYFTKKPDDRHNELIESLLGKPAPTSCVEQQHIFENILVQVTGDQTDLELMKTLHENLITMTEPDRPALKKEDIKQILSEAGVEEEKLTDFDHIYENAGGTENTIFESQNLMELDKFDVKAPDVEIKIKPDRTGLIKQQKIDGKNCIVVTLEGDIALNGIPVTVT